MSPGSSFPTFQIPYIGDGSFVPNGEVHATSGEFSGTLKATTLDGKLIGGANASVDLSDVDYIDLGGLILDGRAGSTGIRFRPGYEPVKYQFGVASTGPWHDAMGTNDKYRRDSLDGGTTWGDPYQFRGADGKNGITIQKGSIKWSGISGKPSIPSLPGYIQSTYIDATKVESFHIKANKMEAVIPVTSQSDTETGFILTGPFDGRELRYLRIYAHSGFPEPITVFSSPQSTHASWDFPLTYFHGILDFNKATTTGLHLTLA